MTSVQRPTTTPLPTCPICGERASRDHYVIADDIVNGSYVCPKFHTWLDKWLIDGGVA